MIRVKNLGFSYPGTAPVLKDINIEINGEATAIIGQNGAGKTTFAKLLKRLLKPEQGSIYILGQDTAKTSAAALSKTIGLVFQNPNDQVFKKSVMEEVMFGPCNLKMSQKEAARRAEDALEMVGLSHYTDINPHDLGLSERKLVCIASVIAMDTKIIIFDEPTIAQDHLGKKRISEIINKLKNEGKLILTIIHDMDFVAENFERTVVFSQGEILLDGQTKEVFAATDILARAKVEPPYIAQLSQRLGWEDICLTEEEFIKRANREVYSN